MSSTGNRSKYNVRLQWFLSRPWICDASSALRSSFSESSAEMHWHLELNRLMKLVTSLWWSVKYDGLPEESKTIKKRVVESKSPQSSTVMDKPNTAHSFGDRTCQGSRMDRCRYPDQRYSIVVTCGLLNDAFALDFLCASARKPIIVTRTSMAPQPPTSADLQVETQEFSQFEKIPLMLYADSYSGSELQQVFQKLFCTT